MLRIVAFLCCLLCGHATAGELEKNPFGAWRLKCAEHCIISQEVVDRRYSALAEVSFVENEAQKAVHLRLTLPPQAKLGDGVVVATNDRNAIKLRTICSEAACIAALQIDLHWLAGTMDDYFLFAFVGISDKHELRMTFHWSGLQQAMMSAHSR